MSLTFPEVRHVRRAAICIIAISMEDGPEIPRHWPCLWLPIPQLHLAVSFKNLLMLTFTLHLTLWKEALDTVTTGQPFPRLSFCPSCSESVYSYRDACQFSVKLENKVLSLALQFPAMTGQDCCS